MKYKIRVAVHLGQRFLYESLVLREKNKVASMCAHFHLLWYTKTKLSGFPLNLPRVYYEIT